MAVKKSQAVGIPAFRPSKMIVEIEGVSSLLCNRVNEKTKDTMPGGKREGEKNEKDSRSWKEVALDGAYRDPTTGAYVFPSAGLMSALSKAAYRMKLAKSGVEVFANVMIPDEWLEIEGPAPNPRQDLARNKNSGGSLIVANRAEFAKGWRMRVPVQFNAAEYDPKKVGMLFEAAGFGVGIGCWRPEKGGRFGRFSIHCETAPESIS